MQCTLTIKNETKQAPTFCKVPSIKAVLHVRVVDPQIGIYLTSPSFSIRLLEETSVD